MSIYSEKMKMPLDITTLYGRGVFVFSENIDYLNFLTKSSLLKKNQVTEAIVL